MADDTGKPLDSNTNDQPDPPKEIIPVEDTKTIIPIQQTEIWKYINILTT